MATAAEIDRFLENYARSWIVGPELRNDLFHPGGGVLYPGASAPFNPDGQPAMSDLIRQYAPDVRFELHDWAARDDTLFAEWSLTFTHTRGL
jgi:hypothetical protein